RPGCRVGGKRSTDTTSGGGSRAHDDEPATCVEHLAAAELRREGVRLEHALVDGPARAVVEDPLLPAFGLLVALPPDAPDDDELGCDATGFGAEPLTFGLLEVAVEVGREDAVEGVVRERKLERVALHEGRVRRLLARDCEHRVA